MRRRCAKLGMVLCFPRLHLGLQLLVKCEILFLFMAEIVKIFSFMPGFLLPFIVNGFSTYLSINLKPIAEAISINACRRWDFQTICPDLKHLKEAIP